MNKGSKEIFATNHIIKIYKKNLKKRRLYTKEQVNALYEKAIEGRRRRKLLIETSGKPTRSQTLKEKEFWKEMYE